MNTGTESHRIPEPLCHKTVSQLGYYEFKKGKLSLWNIDGAELTTLWLGFCAKFSPFSLKFKILC